jgi:hypothetical protein
MHIVYSALSTLQQKPANKHHKQLRQRLQAYHSTCDKYSREIAAIQKYLPGWVPPFEARG